LADDAVDATGDDGVVVVEGPVVVHENGCHGGDFGVCGYSFGEGARTVIDLSQDVMMIK
jgi:hypothetical protein